ncbi:SigE family RNA polymerase sigma factor [Phycicoccus avicenniae]|uniref:SigE family RNA polymerase sigma factor n=1 Tax=Phycicoccus avicenniae TaxID=2828860 RepID=UPI003D2B2BD2
MGTGKKAERDAAFAEFVTASTASLMRTARLLSGSPDAAHELVQATLVRTYLAWDRVREEDALPYARRILVNLRTDGWRRRRGEVVVAQPPDRRHEDGTGPEDRDEIVRLLAALPERQRRVVVLRYYHDLSEQAVAQILGVSVGTVKSSASRGLAALRAARSGIDPKEGSLR